MIKIKNISAKILTVSAVMLSLFLTPGKQQHVRATSVGDVIAYARSVGMPEEQVQYYINLGSGREYTSEQCDQAIAYLASYYAQRDEAISGGETEPEADETPELIPVDDFEILDVHEKKDYIDNIPSGERKEYLDVMTNEEKNQLLKELDTTAQVGVISEMLGFGDALGYDFAIEDVSEGAVMLSARDESGKLVGVTVIGDSVEKTGTTYAVPVFLCSGLILLSAAGMILCLGKCR